MPSGLTPAFPLNQTFKRAQIDGLAPPINKLALSIYRSGNIYIIAEQVNFHGQEISTQKDEEPLFDASGHPRRYFLVTQGLGGGLGGAGSPSDCTNYLNPGGFGDCADGEFLNSGRTGPGGPGGDAGAAYWIHIGGSWSGDFLSIAKRLTSVSGGAPGPNKRFRSPTARGALGATGQANDFLKLQDGSWDQEASGKDGAVVFQAMSAERSLDFVGQLLREKDAQFDYDLSILAKRASTDESITSVTYDDFMAESLGRFIQGGQIHVVDSFEKLIVDKAIDHVPFIPSHLLGLEGSAATLSTLSSSNRQLVRLLTELSSPIDPPISEYFARSGGLFSNFDVKSTKQDLNELYRSVDTSKLNQRLVDLRVPLADISSTLANFDIRQDKNDRLAQLSILKKQLEEAQSKSGSEWMVKLSGGLEEMASAVKNLYAGYSSDNPGMVVVGMRDLVSGWEKARSAWASQDDTGSTAGINQDLAAAESSYNDFLISVEASRQRHSNDSISALIDVLQSRAESGSRILARTKLFDSLIKSSYLMYVDDNGKNVNNFSSNMDGIRTLLIDYPRIVPNINLVNETDNNCVDVQNTCLKIGPQLRQVAVVTPWTLSDGRTTNITLYIVAPTTKPEFFQTRGLDAVIESDGGNTVTKETRGTAAP